MKEIQTKEKVYLEARKSVTKYPGNNKESIASQQSDDQQNAELAGQLEELDYYDIILKERENDVQEVRRFTLI